MPCLDSGRASEAVRRPRPAAAGDPADGTGSAESLAPSPDHPDRRLPFRLDDLGAGAVVSVAEAETGLARSMMASHHPEGDAA